MTASEKTFLDAVYTLVSGNASLLYPQGGAVKDYATLRKTGFTSSSGVYTWITGFSTYDSSVTNSSISVGTDTINILITGKYRLSMWVIANGITSSLLFALFNGTTTSMIGNGFF